MSEKITLQMIFDKAWQAFIVEDKPPAVRLSSYADAVVDKYDCMYLTDDGRRCAVGLALPDAVAKKLKNTLLPFGNLVYHENYRDIFHDDLHKYSSHQLDAFQCELHDELVDEDNWGPTVDERRIAYIAVAAEFGLTIPGERDE